MVKTLYICALLAVTVAVSAASPDQIAMDFDTATGQPIASGLSDPGSWVFLGTKTIPHKLQTMTWVKPDDVAPRESQTLDQPAALRVYVQINKARDAYRGPYSESFEYQNTPRPRGTPKQYFDDYKREQVKACPTGTAELMRVSDNELLMEAKSGGCEKFGDQDEIERFIFGRQSLFHMIYMVKSRDMTPEQRDAAVKAVSAWNLRK
jgi:hypothetical protein